MPNIRITKKFRFEAAHALYGYDGKCKNIHGHNYNLFVTVIGVPVNESTNVKYGMVMDFSDLKIKLVASILAISGIGLLETFLKIAGSGDVAVSEVEIKWMVIIHIIFIISGLLLAMMDYVAHRSSKH